MSEITLICETCTFPIASGKGSIYVRTGDIAARRAAEHEWREAHPAGTAVSVTDLVLAPDSIRWRTGHDTCRADHGEGCYEIDDTRISSWRQVAWWTAHLLEKNWLPLSDWDDVLRELSGEVPSARIRAAAREAA